MIASRDGDDTYVTSEEAWIRTVLKSAFAEPNTDVATSMRNGIRFNPVAIAAVGVSELWRRFSKVEDRDWLLEVASRPDSDALQGLAAALTLIRSSDERLVRSILRVAFASQIRPERKWDEEEGDGVNADRQKCYRQRVTEALIAERGWLNGGREEPSWPKFPLGKRHLRNAVRSKFVGDDDFEPESDGDTFVASQTCARWLRLMTGDEAQADTDWLPTLIAAYEPWTLHANGAGLHSTAQINGHLDEWNAIFFLLFARCIPRLEEGDAIERVQRAIELPDESFFEIAADLVPSLDALYFNDEGGSLALLLKLRAMIGERLRTTDGWRWEGTRNESTVEVHIGPAIGVMFFNHYGSFSGAQAYLKPKGIDRLDPFLGQLEVLIADGPVPFTSQLTMNLLEVAPNAAQLNFFLTSALTWLKRQPDNAQLWIDYGLGVRLAKWLDALLESDPSIAAVGRPARPLIDDVLARLVRIGVSGAHELEQKLSHVSA